MATEEDTPPSQSQDNSDRLNSEDNVDSIQTNEQSTENETTQNQPRQPTFMDRLKPVLFRMVLFYMVMNFFKPQQQKTNQISDSENNIRNSAFHNMYKMGDLMDVFVYCSPYNTYSSFSDDDLFWTVKDVPFGCRTCGDNKDGVFSKRGQLQLNDHILNNGTIYAHVFITKSGSSPDSRSSNYDKFTVHQNILLNKYKKKLYKKTKNLLTGETDKDIDYQKKAEQNVVEIVSHWHPNLTINIVNDQSAWIPNKLAHPLDKSKSTENYLRFLEIIFDYESQQYYPIVFLNTYWNLNADYYPINDTLKFLEFNVDFSPLQFWKWQLYLSQEMQSSWYSNMLGSIDESGSDQDVLKQTLLDTNPYILILTMIVSMLHTFFEILAFKNDIQFWKDRSNLEGLSIRTLLFNIFTSLIVVLYVFDNQTNFAVRVSVALGLLIEMWKIPKIFNICIDRSRLFLNTFPTIRFQFKSSYSESSTSEHDKTAFKYLSVVLFPLVASYAIYSLIYHEHKGWYSWVLSMIYSFLLTFGFIMMTPQLFINYKLKSVAHLPWRMMTYKALNTFIDDIFAFVVKTPTLYRLSCFRDDVIFFIYIYQRWIYRVDHNRINEFGVSGKDCQAEEKTKND